MEIALSFGFILLGALFYLDKIYACAPGDHHGLLIADLESDDIVFFDIESNASVRCNFAGLHSPTDVAVDPEEGYIFITMLGPNYPEGSIVRTWMDGTYNTQIVSSEFASYPWSLTLDPTQRHVYFTDEIQREVMRVSYDGNDVTVIITGGLSAPHAVAIDIVNQRLFWTDTTERKIESSTLSGTDRQELVNTDVIYPTGLEFDAISDRLYWCDGNLDSIESIQTNRTNRQTLVTLTDTAFRDVAIFQGNIFVTDGLTSFIRMTSLSQGSIRVFGRAASTQVLRGVTLYSPADGTTRSKSTTVPSGSPSVTTRSDTTTPSDTTTRRDTTTSATTMTPSPSPTTRSDTTTAGINTTGATTTTASEGTTLGSTQTGQPQPTTTAEPTTTTAATTTIPPPTLSVVSSATQVLEGESFLLRCVTAQGDPESLSNYAWIFTSRYRASYSYTRLTGGNELNVTDATYEASGEYQCKALHNNMMTILSQEEVNVKITYNPQDLDDEFDLTRYVRVTDSVQLTRRFLALPPVVITWSKDGRTLTNFTVVSGLGGVQEMLITILNIEDVSEDDFGTYTVTLQTDSAQVSAQMEVINEGGDECSTNPCESGSSCIDWINGYVCQCPANKKGINCEIDVPRDDSTPRVIISPMFGPVAGSTRLVLAGSQIEFTQQDQVFLSTNQSHVDRPEIMCRTVTVTSEEITCDTPSSDAIGFYYVVVVRDDVVRVVADQRFQYRPNSIITDLYPLRTFTSGGSRLTVVGEHLDSSASPVFTVTEVVVSDDGEITLTEYTTTEIEIVNSKLMFVKTPFVEDEHTQSSGNTDARQPINDQELEFYTGFQFDGLMRYSNLSQFFAEKGNIKVYLAPAFEVKPVSSEPDVYDREKDRYYRISGERLLLGAAESDYSIKLGNSSCSIDRVTDNLIVCEPPDREPAVEMEVAGYREGIPRVWVVLGTRYYVSTLNYAQSRVIPIWGLVVMAIAGFILIIIHFCIVCIGCRRENNKEEVKSREAMNPFESTITPSPQPPSVGMQPLETEKVEAERVDQQIELEGQGIYNTGFNHQATEPPVSPSAHQADSRASSYYQQESWRDYVQPIA